MTRQPAAPSEADAPRPWARAILHAHIPALLKILLLALFAAFTTADTTSRALKRLRRDWLFTSNSRLNEDLDSAQDEYALRRIHQLRALIGWLMRGTRNKGMAPLGNPTPVLRQAQPARAPP